LAKAKDDEMDDERSGRLSPTALPSAWFSYSWMCVEYAFRK